MPIKFLKKIGEKIADKTENMEQATEEKINFWLLTIIFVICGGGLFLLCATYQPEETDAAGSELTELRTYDSRTFSDTPTKRFVNVYSGVVNVFDGQQWLDLENDLSGLKFPEGKELPAFSKETKIADIPVWATAKLTDSNSVELLDANGVNFLTYHDPIVQSVAVSSSYDIGGWEIKDNAVYFKIPQIFSSEGPVKIYDDIVSSTAAGFAKIDSAAPTANDHTSAAVEVGFYSVGPDKIRHITHNHVPAEPGGGPWEITGASYFQNWESSAGTGSSIAIYKLTAIPDTDTCTWNIRSTGNNWSTPGGDYNAAEMDTVVSDATGWHEWVLEGAGSENPLTLDWEEELNLILRDTNESGTSNYKTITTGAAASNKTYIQYTYEAGAPPEPPISTSTPSTSTLFQGFYERYNTVLIYFAACLIFLAFVIGIYRLICGIMDFYKQKFKQ